MHMTAFWILELKVCSSALILTLRRQSQTIQIWRIFQRQACHYQACFAIFINKQPASCGYYYGFVLVQCVQYQKQ